jgi:hypothetical protein
VVAVSAVLLQLRRKMPSISAAVKLFLVLWFLWYTGLFFVSRVHLFYASVREHSENMNQAETFCGMCDSFVILQKASNYAKDCAAACQLAKDSASSWEVGMRKVFENTYLCGYTPCEETWAKFNLKACLFIVLMSFGFWYTTHVFATGSEDAKRQLTDSYPSGKPCWLVGLLCKTASSLQAALYHAFVALDADPLDSYSGSSSAYVVGKNKVL